MSSNEEQSLMTRPTNCCGVEPVITQAHLFTWCVNTYNY